MVNQAVWSIKLIELLFLFCSKWVWLTKQLGLPGYVVTRNCGKIRTSKKPSKLYNYQLKGVRSFLTQKESRSDWECIVLAGSSLKKPSILYNYQLKGVRSFLTQKESGSEWECIVLAGSHAVPSVAHEVQTNFIAIATSFPLKCWFEQPGVRTNPLKGRKDLALVIFSTWNKHNSQYKTMICQYTV